MQKYGVQSTGGKMMEKNRSIDHRLEHSHVSARCALANIDSDLS